MSVRAILESLLKRKWHGIILQHLRDGAVCTLSLSLSAPEVSRKVINERLHALLRYGLIVRGSRDSSPSPVNYHLTDLGRAMLDVLDRIEQLDRMYRASSGLPDNGNGEEKRPSAKQVIRDYKKSISDSRYRLQEGNQHSRELADVSNDEQTNILECDASVTAR